MAYDRPFRLRVLDALTDCLRNITPANGYAHDLSSAVFRGRAMFGDDDPLPMVSILEPPVAPDQIASSLADSAGGWDLLVQGFVQDDRLNPTDPAYLLLADVKRALALEQVRREGRMPNPLGMGGGAGSGNEVTGIDIGAGVVRPADDVSAKAYFWLTLTLQVVEDPENPYA